MRAMVRRPNAPTSDDEDDGLRFVDSFGESAQILGALGVLLRYLRTWRNRITERSAVFVALLSSGVQRTGDVDHGHSVERFLLSHEREDTTLRMCLSSTYVQATLIRR